MDNLIPSRINLQGFIIYCLENETFLIEKNNTTFTLRGAFIWHKHPNIAMLFPTKRSAKRFIKKYIVDLEPTATYCSVHANDKALKTVTGGTFDD
jgi:hypothetical protein